MPKLPLPVWEFVGLVGILMALNALAIDIMLPALDDIARHYDLSNQNDQQLILFSYILGFGIPQLFFGPVTDRFGRRGVLRICLLAYIGTAFLCMLTTSFSLLLLMRFVQGVFASGVRVVAVSVVRDLTSGRSMARIMSLIMTVFMVVPIIAPAIGQGVLLALNWQWIFGVLGVAATLVLLWSALRLPETLAPEDRKSISAKAVIGSFWTVLSHRVSLGYMTASGVIFGALFAFIGAAEQIFGDAFGEDERFVIWFAVIAIALACANFLNSAMVERFGMRRISHAVLIIFIGLSAANYGLMKYVDETIWLFVPLFALTFGCFGMLGANFSAIAMEPQGENVGIASSLYGFATTSVASFFGWFVARSFNGSVVPILLGFIVLGVLSLLIVMITERGNLFETGQ